MSAKSTPSSTPMPGGPPRWRTTFVDIDWGRLPVIVPGRSGHDVREWVGSQPIWWADRIDVTAIDE